MTMRIELSGILSAFFTQIAALRVTLGQLATAQRNGESSITLLNFHPGKIRLGRFRNFDGADIGKDVGGDVGWDIVCQWGERLVLVGALEGNAEAPGMKRRAA